MDLLGQGRHLSSSPTRLGTMQRLAHRFDRCHPAPVSRRNEERRLRRQTTTVQPLGCALPLRSPLGERPKLRDLRHGPGALRRVQVVKWRETNHPLLRMRRWRTLWCCS
jgi:hypothetical protein